MCPFCHGCVGACRGAWARVTIDQFRRLSLSAFEKHSDIMLASRWNEPVLLLRCVSGDTSRLAECCGKGYAGFIELGYTLSAAAVWARVVGRGHASLLTGSLMRLLRAGHGRRRRGRVWPLRCRLRGHVVLLRRARRVRRRAPLLPLSLCSSVQLPQSPCVHRFFNFWTARSEQLQAVRLVYP